MLTDPWDVDDLELSQKYLWVRELKSKLFPDNTLRRQPFLSFVLFGVVCFIIDKANQPHVCINKSISIYPLQLPLQCLSGRASTLLSRAKHREGITSVKSMRLTHPEIPHHGGVIPSSLLTFPQRASCPSRRLLFYLFMHLENYPNRTVMGCIPSPVLSKPW